MSIKIMSLAWDLKLSSTEKLVLLALADCANDEGEAWPSIATLSRKACIGERSVQRSIQALKDAGHLSRHEVVGKGCRYFIHPRHNDTPATVSPVTDDTPPPPQCHHTPATVAPKPSMNHQEPSITPNGVKRAREPVQAEPKKVRMTSDWKPCPLPPTVKALADLWPPGRLQREVDQFRDYWIDRTEKRPGWDRTFHNRIRDIHDKVLREASYAQPRNFQSARPSVIDIGRSVAADLVREAEASAGR